jgi:mannan endo-1,4-beta-mannosidase
VTGESEAQNGRCGTRQLLGQMRTLLRQSLSPLVVLGCLGWVHANERPFITRQGTHLRAGDQRFYFLGASCYYLAYWAADTSRNPRTGRTFRQDADAYLERCRDSGFSVIRVWAFNDGKDARALQTAPGQYREQAFVGYDHLLKRSDDLGLRIVMCLVNNWNDFGGMRWYATNSNPSAVHSDFYTDPQCRAWYRDHLFTMVHRTNSITGRVYRDDPTIFAWQLANEPRWHGSPKDADSVDTSGMTIRNWVWDMATYLKSLDPNHLISTGEEGWTATESWEGTRWELNNASPHIDYAVIHCWPDWWTWMWGDEPELKDNALAWVVEHLEIAANLGKPLVLSEYGKNRPLEGAGGRHAYYDSWFEVIHRSALADGPACGLHFWMLEADGSDHDDGFSVFPHEVETLDLLSQQARVLNKLISPTFTQVRALNGNNVGLAWTEIVGSPHYEVLTSQDLSKWTVADTIATNTWSGTISPDRRFYSIRPYWP